MMEEIMKGGNCALHRHHYQGPYLDLKTPTKVRRLLAAVVVSREAL
jgi:hypothetical protein